MTWSVYLTDGHAVLGVRDTRHGKTVEEERRIQTSTQMNPLPWASPVYVRPDPLFYETIKGLDKEVVTREVIDLKQRVEALFTAPHVPPTRPSSPALDGIPKDDKDAITNKVPLEEVNALVALLTPKSQRVNKLRKGFASQPWFPNTKAPNTQDRRIRTIVSAAIAAGHPVCTDNKGYFLGGKADVLASAARKRGHAAGSIQQAEQLEALAETMP